MPTRQERIDEIEADLVSVRQKIRIASDAATTSLGNKSLVNQNLDSLRALEVDLANQLANLRTNSPIGVINIRFE